MVTRDARGIDSQGSARDSSRVINSQAIGDDRREPGVQLNLATTDYINMSKTELVRLILSMKEEHRRRDGPWEQEDGAQHVAENANRQTDGWRDVCPRRLRGGVPEHRGMVDDNRHSMDSFDPESIETWTMMLSSSECSQCDRGERWMSSKSAPICLGRRSLYETWENIAQKIIPDGVSIYSNFLYTFGDDTDEDTDIEEETMRIDQVLLQFEQTKELGQQAILKDGNARVKQALYFRSRF